MTYLSPKHTGGWGGGGGEGAQAPGQMGIIWHVLFFMCLKMVVPLPQHISIIICDLFYYYFLLVIKEVGHVGG